MGMKLTKALKFRVHSEEHSKAIQERLFELGASWFYGGTVVKHISQKYLCLNSEHELDYGNNESCFNNNHYQEAILDDLYSPEFLKPEETCQAKSVVIDGKKYKLVLDE